MKFSFDEKQCSDVGLVVKHGNKDNEVEDRSVKIITKALPYYFKVNKATNEELLEA